MNVTVKGRQMDVGEALRGYVADNLGGAVSKFFPNSIDGQVIFGKDAHLSTVDIQLHAGRGIVLQSHGKAGDPYPAFDTALDKLARQLQKHKKRLVDHHHRPEQAEAAPEPASSYVLDESKEAANEQPLVIAEMQTVIETLTVSEAVMRMDLGDLPAVMFRSRSHGGLGMVYRRADGNIGWVDPVKSK